MNDNNKNITKRNMLVVFSADMINLRCIADKKFIIARQTNYEFILAIKLLKDIYF